MGWKLLVVAWQETKQTLDNFDSVFIIFGHKMNVTRYSRMCRSGSKLIGVSIFSGSCFDHLWTTNKHIGVIAKLNTDRKSTRLNSSHVRISYAVFCLKKK